jgi:hypothetical protein
MSMAGRDSAGPFMRGVTEAGSAPRAARSSRSGQGEQWPSGGERDGLAGEQSGGSVVIKYPLQDELRLAGRKRERCYSTMIHFLYLGTQPSNLTNLPTSHGWQDCLLQIDSLGVFNIHLISPQPIHIAVPNKLIAML